MAADGRARGGVSYWGAIGVVVLCLYVLSFGPVSGLVCWAARNDMYPDWATAPMEVIYYPLEAASHRDDWFGYALQWYIGFFGPVLM